MALFVKRWGGGEVSLVEADDAREASMLIDAIGDPSPLNSVRQLRDRVAFQLTVDPHTKKIVVDLDRFLSADVGHEGLKTMLGLPTGLEDDNDDEVVVQAGE